MQTFLPWSIDIESTGFDDWARLYRESLLLRRLFTGNKWDRQIENPIELHFYSIWRPIEDPFEGRLDKIIALVLACITYCIALFGLLYDFICTEKVKPQSFNWNIVRKHWGPCQLISYTLPGRIFSLQRNNFEIGSILEGIGRSWRAIAIHGSNGLV